MRERVRDQIKFSFSENLLWYALVLGLAVVLALLALLQYRSGRQVNDATTEQMRASLQGSLMDLRQGVERELTPLCHEFQADSEISRSTALQEYGNHLERWRRAAAHPGLVTDVYVWRALDGNNPEFLQLNGKHGEIASTNWPAEFEPLRQWLRQVSPQSLGYGGGGVVADSHRKPVPDHAPMASAQPSLARPSFARPSLTHPSFPWVIDESIPALVHPVLESEKHSPEKSTPATLSWIVIRLNLEVLGQRIFPDLALRYFGKNSRSVYKLAVIADKTPGGVIYASDEKFGSPEDIAADASLNIFGPPVSILGAQHLPFERMFGSGGPPNPSRPSGLARPLGPNFADHEGGPLRIDPIHYASGERGWTVLARHREGSVEAAVAASYRRNLLINFGVLLILAITMGLIIATSQRARRLAQSQVDFVAGVSHELRTPLTGIVSAAQNIADGLVDNKERMARYGAAILSQAEQLTDLIEQILLFSATQKDLHRYHFQLVDVAEVIDASLESTASLCRSAGFTVHRKIQPGLPRVMVDVMALTQCLQNLIANSVKYSGSSRWIEVEASIANDAHRGKEVMITVEDRGLGMEPKELKRIFEPFYRSPVVTAAQIHGSGLGLPLAKSMVEAMGGKLTVTSEPRKGSKFTIHLPTPDTFGGQPSSLATPEADPPS